MSIKVKIGAMSLFMAVALGMSGCSNETNNTDGAASTQEVTTLRFSHFWPATAPMHVDVFEPWAKKLETESNGRLKVEIYPSATLSKPDVTYDAVAKGTVDIGSQLQGYSAGRFPLTQIAELPGLSDNAVQLSCMLQMLYDDDVISSEYEDTHLLFMIGSGPAVLHTVDKTIRTPKDMIGLRIRKPSAVAGDIIEAAGGSSIGLPATDLYTSLQRGVINGLSMPWSPTGDFKLTEITNNHTDVSFVNAGLLVTMNKDKYESLPADLKKIIDDNSGKDMAKIGGEMFDREDARFREQARAKGDTMIEIPDPLNHPEWKDILVKGSQDYIDDVNSLGLEGDAVYEKTKAASAACKA